MKREVEAAGLSWRTIERAKSSLGIVACKAGFGGGWSWRLKDANPANTAREQNFGGLGGLGGLCSSSSTSRDTSRESASEDRQDRQPVSAGGVDPLTDLLDQRITHLRGCSTCTPAAWTERRPLCPDGEALRLKIAAELARREEARRVASAAVTP